MSIKNNEVSKGLLYTVELNKASAFTFKDLQMMNDIKQAYKLPLSTIALCDMNAFFAQVERNRLGMTDDDPVTCVQWNSLIAVSYAAKKYGISRMDNVQSAKEKCPNVILSHAAVFKKGNSYWSYYDELPEQDLCKVSLDPYRREGRKIVNIYKKHCDLVEKSSVDESYLDLGRLVYAELLESFPELKSLPDDLMLPLPKLPPSLPPSLHWQGVIYESEADSKEESENIENQEKKTIKIIDWDDICMLVGSQILFRIRQDVFDELGYTTSGGVANNKLVAKLAAGFHKPDCQTIIRNQLLNKFLQNFKLTDITGLGGKLGDSITEKFELPEKNSIGYLRENYTSKDVQQEFKDNVPFANELYNIVRGIDRVELTPRSDVKSMMSRKNFMTKNPVDNFADAYDWLLVFAGDLYNRMIELDDEAKNLSMTEFNCKAENIRRPKTLSIQITTTNFSNRSKQIQLPVCIKLEQFKDTIKSYSLELLKQIMDSLCNLSLLNNDRPVKDILRETDLKKVKCIKLKSMGLVVSNFVKVNSSASIDLFAGKATEDKELILKKFHEYNDAKIPEDTAVPNPKKQDLDKEYISKLFANFEESENKNIIEEPVETNKEKLKLDKEKQQLDKEYIAKLFDDFKKEFLPEQQEILNLEQTYSTLNLNSKVESESRAKKRNQSKLSSAAKKAKSSKNDILANLRFSQRSPEGPDSNNSQFCTKCNDPVENTQEHLDYHYALELSERINTS